ncbi:MAG: nucleotide exchange factor GrpE [Bacteroidales bacterium]|nr:nucleotide exchange factor GrpE [Bacteroidales bacterium]
MDENVENVQNGNSENVTQNSAKSDNLASETVNSAQENAELEDIAASDVEDIFNDIEENGEDTKEENDEPTEKKTVRSIFGKKVSKEDKLKEQIAQLEAQKKELNDKFLHLYSEFDNYKKRTNKEKLDLLSTASEKVIISLLPIIDDFERAIKANENLEDLQVIKEGFTLIYNKLIQVLKRFDVEEIVAKGETFDTDYHEAITHFPAPTEEDKGKVMEVTEKGYKIKNKVIRFSKVVVAN